MLNRVASETTYPALISSDLCQFTASIDLKIRISPVSSPTASIRLVGTLVYSKCVRRLITNSFVSVEGANATAVQALGNFRSAIAVHLAKSPWRHCHIFAYIHSSSPCGGFITDHSTVLSLDAVAKTLPSGAQAQSQIIRACDLSMATGSYPGHVNPCASHR